MWGFECIDLVVDLRCECRNPDCPEYKKVLADILAKSKSKPKHDDTKRLFIKTHAKTIRYSFSNIDERLFELYPPAISINYPFFSRQRSLVSLRLRRDWYSVESEASIISRMEDRYRDYYLSHNVQDYTKIVLEHGGMAGIFPRPPSMPPKCLMPMSGTTLKSIQDDFWVKDRERCVRTLMEVTCDLTMSCDYTFEIARTVSGCGAAILILNEQQVPMFFGFCEKEDREGAYGICRKSRWHMRTPNSSAQWSCME